MPDWAARVQKCRGGSWTKKVKVIRRTEALIVGTRDVDSRGAAGLSLSQHSYYVYDRRLRFLCCLAAAKWAGGSMRGATWLSAPPLDSPKNIVAGSALEEHFSQPPCRVGRKSKVWGFIYGKPWEQSTVRLKADWCSS